MTAIQPPVIEHKPAFWSRPRLFIGACVVVVAGIGGALYTQDSVKSAATLVTTTQQPAAQIMAHKDYLEVEPIASTAPAPDQSLELWAIPKDGTPVSLGLLPEDGKGIIGLNPRQQFRRGKGFADVIVNSCIEAVDFIGFFGACREHNHRNVLGVGIAL